jgi:hypothetical protein
MKFFFLTSVFSLHEKEKFVYVYVLKAYGIVEVQPQLLYPQHYMEIIWHIYAPVALPPEKSPAVHWIGNWVRSRAWQEILEEYKQCITPTGNRTVIRLRPKMYSSSVTLPPNLYQITHGNYLLCDRNTDLQNRF